MPARTVREAPGTAVRRSASRPPVQLSAVARVRWRAWRRARTVSGRERPWGFGSAAGAGGDWAGTPPGVRPGAPADEVAGVSSAGAGGARAGPVAEKMSSPMRVADAGGEGVDAGFGLGGGGFGAGEVELDLAGAGEDGGLDVGVGGVDGGGAAVDEGLGDDGHAEDATGEVGGG